MPTAIVAGPHNYGVAGDGVTDDTAGIQAAINAAAAFGAHTLLPGPGPYRHTATLSLPSGTTLFSRDGAVLQLDANTAVRQLTNSDRTNGNSDITLDGITLDGQRTPSNDGRTLGSNHAFYFEKIARLTLRNVRVRNPIAFGGLVIGCTDAYVQNHRVEANMINQDGIHFFDCARVALNGLVGTAGDDLLGISANLGDLRDFTVSNVIGSSAFGSIVRVNQTDRSVAAGESRTIERLTFRNIVGVGTGNKGFSINDVHSSSTVRAIDLSGAIFTGTARSGLDIVRCTDSSFDVTLIDCGNGAGVTSSFTLHPVYVATNVTRCRFNVRVRGVPDGYNAIRITGGDSLIIHPEIYYPTAGFASPQPAVNLVAVTDSTVSDGITDGASRGVQVGSSTTASSRVTVTDMVIKNNTGFAIAEGTLAGVDNNRFADNTIKTGGISRSGPNTIIERNQGYRTESRGTATIASGATSVTVAHGLAVAPTNVQITGRDAETSAAYLGATPDSTSLQIAVPAAVTAARTVDWSARAA